MSNSQKLIQRFARDERGVFAVIFGLLAIVLIAMGGAVVDYVSLEQTRARAQTALDAAALALQPDIFLPGYSDATVKAKAQAIMIERIGDARVTATIESVTTDIPNGSLYFKARLTVPTMFVNLVGVNDLSTRIESEATRKKLALEVVMVLDNSGSMQNDSRMTNLVAAAKCATYILMYDKVVDSGGGTTCVPATGAKLVPNVKVGIVPFTMYVNVGAGNANAAWMDRFNNSVIANDNFDNNDDEDTALASIPPYVFPTRFELFAATGEAWRGCVEERPHIKTGSQSTEYLDTDDTAPTGGNTLFVPMLSPDIPDGQGGNSYLSDSPAVCDRPAQGTTNCVETETRTCYWWGCGSSSSSGAAPVSGAPTNFLSTARFPKGIYGAQAPSCTCRTWTSWSSWSGSGTQTRTRSCSGGGYVPTGLSNRELQERVCKYYQTPSVSSFSQGPNADCTRTAILPMTDNPTTVINTINSMQAEGGTNIHAGTVWGFRALSPTEPFTQGAAYGGATSKVMIVMTDGENTAYNLSGYCNDSLRSLNGSCYNSAYGFPYNGSNNTSASTSGGNITRMGPLGTTNANLVTEMNTRTSQTCENAKAAGITLYTIGLATDTVSQSTPQVVRNMLTNCATSSDKAHFPSSSSQLKTVFAAIANDLSALRLAR